MPEDITKIESESSSRHLWLDYQARHGVSRPTPALSRGPADLRAPSTVKLGAVLAGHLDHSRDIQRTWRNLPIQRGEHLDCFASRSRDF